MPFAECPDATRQGLALVHKLLRLEIERMRAAGVPVGEDEYRGLYISDGEADRLLRRAPEENEDDIPSAANVAIDELRTAFTEFAAAAGGRIGHLREGFALSTFEIGLLLLCLAAETDLGTERLVAYVQDDVSKRRPRLELGIRLFGARDTALGALHAGAPLLAMRLVALHDESGQPHTPFASRFVSLDPRLARYLQGDGAVDERLQAHAVVVPPSASEAPLPEPLASQVAHLARHPARKLEPPTLGLTGPDPRRNEVVASTLAAGSNLGLLTIDLPPLVEHLGLDLAWALATREAALQDAVLLLSAIDRLRPEDQATIKTRLHDHRAPLLVFTSRTGLAWPGLALEIPPLDYGDRRARWEAELLPHGASEPATLDAIAGKFRLSTTEIANAVKAARGAATARDTTNPEITRDDLYAAARSQSTPILSGLARKVTPHYGWTDIILEGDPLQQLGEMCRMVEHRHLVYETWGFERKLAMGKGLMALFAGASGTGKTMAADVIAGQLGLDLYKIDLSGVVSKYIGETEKNLGSIFAEAETSNAILFFDEADALFGKRSEVKDAHDRYANIETAYLLQKMEEYSGPVILSTNLKMNLDEAFLRRLHFVIDFPMPEEAQRKGIWESTIPDEAPRASDIDFGFLARQFKISGGNIRNIVLAAAFLAAGDGQALGMAHLIRATRREFQKLGKMVTEAEFGPYIVHLREGDAAP